MFFLQVGAAAWSSHSAYLKNLSFDVDFCAYSRQAADVRGHHSGDGVA
jgi:hypothetical protein